MKRWKTINKLLDDAGLPSESSRLTQVDTGQMVLLGNLLSPQVFLDGNRIVRPSLDRVICRRFSITMSPSLTKRRVTALTIGHDHALDPRNTSNPRDDATSWHLFPIVKSVAGKLTQLQERGAWIQKLSNSVPRKKFVSRKMERTRLCRASETDFGQVRVQLVRELVHGQSIVLKTSQKEEWWRHGMSVQ